MFKNMELFFNQNNGKHKYMQLRSILLQTEYLEFHNIIVFSLLHFQKYGSDELFVCEIQTQITLVK